MIVFFGLNQWTEIISGMRGNLRMVVFSGKVKRREREIERLRSGLQGIFFFCCFMWCDILNQDRSMKSGPGINYWLQVTTHGQLLPMLISETHRFWILRERERDSQTGDMDEFVAWSALSLPHNLAESYSYLSLTMWPKSRNEKKEPIDRRYRSMFTYASKISTIYLLFWKGQLLILKWYFLRNK